MRRSYNTQRHLVTDFFDTGVDLDIFFPKKKTCAVERRE